MRLLISVFLILAATAGTFGDACKCEKVEPDVETIWCCNEMFEPIIERRVRKNIHGSVSYALSEQRIGRVLVEVFTNPEYLRQESPTGQMLKPKRAQRRVAACTADFNGEFCFAHIPPGKYEVRVSAHGVSTRQVLVIVNPHSRRSAKAPLLIEVHPGT
ncbi:MAG TPA: carboxypeptidase-like regulatory domain-containing protein [Pyrinomonadaceae bacterium]|jgi:hypothetical protein